MTRTTELATVTALQQQLSNAIVLYLNYKWYHWQTFGPLFRDLHLLFDEHGKQILQTLDPLGERMRILGASPVPSPLKVPKIATVSQPREPMTMHDMLQEASTNHQRVIEGLEDAIWVADAVGDPGTSNLLVEILQLHEKQAWFLREALQRGDGLVT